MSSIKFNIPHGIEAKAFISWVNFYTQNETKRCRILLAEIILRLEKLQKLKKKRNKLHRIITNCNK